LVGSGFGYGFGSGFDGSLVSSTYLMFHFWFLPPDTFQTITLDPSPYSDPPTSMALPSWTLTNI
jgi:hypothetical protein